MIFSWTKQFLMASAVFAIIIAAQAVSIMVEENRMAEQGLDDSYKTVRVMIGNQNHLN